MEAVELLLNGFLFRLGLGGLRKRGLGNGKDGAQRSRELGERRLIRSRRSGILPR